MDTAPNGFDRIGAASKQFARHLLTIGENRIELLMLEVQEERESLLHAVLLALGIAAFGLLAGFTFTAAIVVLLWAWSPLAVLLSLTLVYGVVAVCLCRRLDRLRRDSKSLSASLDQLRKDRECLEKLLG
ncbi:MAG: phage holin family protein [Opitutaceae bacterium]|nr:phage holin family protein [Verrucomicrobiales bacterium]